MKRATLEFRAASDGSLGVFAAEPLVSGALVEHCYCLPLKPSAIPGDLLSPWLYDRGLGGDEPLLFSFGWGLLYNEVSHERSEANVDWQHETTTDANGTELDYIALRTITDVALGDELCCSRCFSRSGQSRDVLRTLFEAVAANPDITLPKSSLTDDAEAPELDVPRGIINSSWFQDVAVQASPLHGNGVYAKRAFAKGELIEIAPNLLFDRWELGMCLCDYQFNLRAGCDEQGSSATGHSSLPWGVKVALGIGSIFNHKDEANVGYRPANVSGHHPAQGYMTCYYALCDVDKGDEMFISYGKKWWESRAEKSLSLAEWRLKRGEAISGRPFYDDPSFAQTCKGGMSPAIVEKLHRTFVDAEDGETSVLKAWMGLCAKLEDSANIRGGINTPLRETGERALHRAAAFGHLQKLKWLVMHGADIAAATAPALDLSSDGDMSSSLYPAHVAAIYGQLDALRLLQSSGADLNCRRPDGATPLDFAEDAGQGDVAAWLLSHGGVRGITS